MWRFRHSFLLVSALSHGVLVSFGFPFIHESITQMLPEWWQDMNSAVGWVLVMFGAWGAPIILIGFDVVLFLAPTMSILLLYLLSRRFLPRTTRSFINLSFWTVGMVLIITAYLGLEMAVTGQFPPPGVITHHVDTVRAVPMSVHVLAVVSGLLSASILTWLIKRQFRKADAQAV